MSIVKINLYLFRKLKKDLKKDLQTIGAMILSKLLEMSLVGQLQAEMIGQPGLLSL